MNKILSTDPPNNSLQRIDRVRFSLRLPIKESIQLQILADQLKRNRNEIIVDAISEYLKSYNRNQELEMELNKVKEEINEIKKMINKANK